jgi:UDP-N-acetylglucosamine 4,6-dehydratase/UDP-glucose 4-epimerase
VIGSQNFVEACLDTVPEIAVGISTDKACSPLNLYGATKLCMERLFIAANRYKGKRKTIFTCVRYGNVLGSTESVVPVWIEQAAMQKQITVTNPDMTRFSITIDEAVDFIFASMKYARGSEIFVPKLKSYAVKDLAAAFVSSLNGARIPIKVLGTRIGEKDHEILVNEHEMRFTHELPFGYVINQRDTEPRLATDQKLSGLSCYSSDTAERHTIQELAAILRTEAVSNPS